MKAVIFGINGQDGFYLNELLHKHNVDVVGVSRSNTAWCIGDVTNNAFVKKIIKQNQPDYIFHLAANSTTKHDALYENHATISTGTLNILESVYTNSPYSKVFLSGSGLQFVNKGKPISENDSFDASSPYAVARIQSTYAARYYRKLDVKAYVGYFFNHDSPLRSERHINQKIVQAAKRIAINNNEKIEIGNINVKKEFTFAKDIVGAVWIFMQNDKVYEAVLGSGKAYSIEKWLHLCFNHFNLNWVDHVIVNNNYVPEYDILISDPSTLFKLGWHQKTDIEKLASIMIEYA